VTLVLGLAASLVRGGLALVGGQGGEKGYRIVRTVFGRSILLGLEFLVAAAIIRTVAVQPSLQNVAVLGLIVLIRTFLSFSLGWRSIAAGRGGAPRSRGQHRYRRRLPPATQEARERTGV
jgi:uncharacterized membrane protein